MNKRHITGSVGALLASGVVASCLSSAATGPTIGEDAGLVCSSDASVVTLATQVDAGLCGACVQSQCGTLLATCSTDCACNNSALQAIGCVESLGANPTTTAITSCLTALGNSADGTLDQLATCLQGCTGACGLDAGGDASILEAGPDATIAEAGVDASVADTGSDSSIADTGSDVAVDTGVDANPDSSSSCGTTSISGTVYDPVGDNPLPGVTVFIPSGALPPFTSGATCSCGQSAPSIATTTTGVDGTFTLTGVPSGSVSVVVQTGKWRRAFPVVVTPCVNNPVAQKMQLPSSGSQGNMPDIAVSTGEADSLECLLSRMGVSPTEFVAGAGTGGHIHMFSGGSSGPDAGQSGLPEVNGFAGAPASATSLWDSQTDLMPYDILVLSCEGGGETYGANPTALESYVNLGGRVLASHFHYSWFAGALVSGQGYSAPSDWGTNLAAWTGGAAPGDGGTTPTIGATPVTTFPKGAVNSQWLGVVGAATAGELPILTPRYNAFVGINGPAQSWLLADNSSGAPGASMLFTFDTPVNAAALEDGGPPPYCGRVAYTDLHDDQADTTNTAGGHAAPNGCVAGTLSPQEKELEFLLFDLGGCVVPDNPAP